MRSRSLSFLSSLSFSLSRSFFSAFSDLSALSVDLDFLEDLRFLALSDGGLGALRGEVGALEGVGIGGAMGGMALESEGNEGEEAE